MTRPTKYQPLPEPWLTMAERAGGVAKLAAIFEVTPQTIWRWGHDVKRPHSRIVVRTVNAWAAEHGIEPPWADPAEPSSLEDILRDGIRKGLQRT